MGNAAIPKKSLWVTASFQLAKKRTPRARKYSGTSQGTENRPLRGRFAGKAMSRRFNFLSYMDHSSFAVTQTRQTRLSCMKKTNPCRNNAHHRMLLSEGILASEAGRRILLSTRSLFQQYLL